MMKTLKILFFIPVLVLFMAACNDGQNGQDAQSEDHMEMHDGNHEGHETNSRRTHSGQDGSVDGKDKTGPEFTSAYVCPMHCEGSGSDESGECPVCGMEDVKHEDM